MSIWNTFNSASVRGGGLTRFTPGTPVTPATFLPSTPNSLYATDNNIHLLGIASTSGNNSINTIYYSYNLTNWFSYVVPILSDNKFLSLGSRLIYLNNRFYVPYVAASNISSNFAEYGIYTSEDGLNWNTQNVVNDSTSVIQGTFTDGNNIILIRGATAIPSTQASKLLYSWIDSSGVRNDFEFSTGLTQISIRHGYFVNGKYYWTVWSGSENESRLYRSDTLGGAITQLNHPPPIGATPLGRIVDIKYANNLFYVLVIGQNNGNNTSIFTTTDFVTYTSINYTASRLYQYPNAFNFANNLFVFSGYDTSSVPYVGKIWSSPTGATLTQRSTLGLYDVQYNPVNGLWSVVGLNYTNNRGAFMTSPDGITWTQRL